MKKFITVALITLLVFSFTGSAFAWSKGSNVQKYTSSGKAMVSFNGFTSVPSSTSKTWAWVKVRGYVDGNYKGSASDTSSATNRSITAIAGFGTPKLSGVHVYTVKADHSGYDGKVNFSGTSTWTWIF